MVGKNRAEFWKKKKECRISCGFAHSEYNVDEITAEAPVKYQCSDHLRKKCTSSVGIETLCTVRVCCNNFDTFINLIHL